MKRLNVIGLLAIAYTGLAFASAEAAVQIPQTASIECNGVLMKASLAKTTFALYEPIVVSVTVCNVTDRPMRIAEPDDNWTTILSVVQVSGAEKFSSPVPSDGPSAPANYGWDFGPGDERSYEFEINHYYPKQLPVGAYRLTVAYIVPHAVRDVWRGHIALAPIMFDVINASPEGSSLGQAFWKCIGAVPTSVRSSALAHLANTAYGENGGVYASIAKYAEAYASFDLGNKDEYYRAIRAFIAKHPETPYYSERARMGLARRLCGDRRYDEAFEVLTDCREGWHRSNVQALCELRKRIEP